MGAPPVTNAEVSGFLIEKEVGQGATGKVYKATRRTNGETVAIKILHLSLLNDVELVKRFKLEAELTSRLSSHHIVTVKEYGLLHDARPFMVMDYIEGCCLSQIIDQNGALPARQALPIFTQVALGLAHAHERGVMHRDIKLNNIMLIPVEDELQTVKIVDFGIAKQWLKSCADTALTRTGEAIGSPLYMSPEQCLGRGMDYRTDIYSLGAVMYEVLTGRPIFKGSDAVSVMAQHISDVPEPMALPPSPATKALERIVFKALSKKPEDRYVNAYDMRADLLYVLDNLKANEKKSLWAA